MSLDDILLDTESRLDNCKFCRKLMNACDAMYELYDEAKKMPTRRSIPMADHRDAFNQFFSEFVNHEEADQQAALDAARTRLFAAIDEYAEARQRAYRHTIALAAWSAAREFYTKMEKTDF